LRDIPVSLSIESVVRHLRLVRRGGEALARELLAQAEPLVRARALFKEAFIEEKGDDWVRVGGIVFRSKILRTNLEKAEKVFPFVITVGGALEAAASRAGDLLRQYDLETIADLSLAAAGDFLEGSLRRRFGLAKLASLSPGSLEDWPITEQTGLFRLLGDTRRSVGVRLSESLLMIPRKSVSGIFFPTEESFSACQLCARDRCPGRRAGYEPGLWRKFEKIGNEPDENKEENR
jgi:hypothetical protein